MSPNPNAVLVAMDEKESADLSVEIFLCNDCYCGDINLAQLAEKVAKNKEKTDENYI